MEIGGDIVLEHNESAIEPEAVPLEPEILCRHVPGLGTHVPTLATDGDVVGPSTRLVACFGYEAGAIDPVGDIVGEVSVAVVTDKSPARRTPDDAALDHRRLVAEIGAGAMDVHGVATADIVGDRARDDRRRLGVQGIY